MADSNNACLIADLENLRKRLKDTEDGKIPSWSKIAVAAEVSSSLISRMLREESEPSQTNLLKILRTLRATPDDIHRVLSYRGFKSPELNLEKTGISEEDRKFADSLAPYLTGYVDLYWNVLYANEQYANAYPGLVENGNVLRWFFFDSSAKNVMVEWNFEAELTVNWLRHLVTNEYERPETKELFEELNTSEEFRTMWRKFHILETRPKPNMLIRSNDRLIMLNVRLLDVPWIQQRPTKMFLATKI